MSMGREYLPTPRLEWDWQLETEDDFIKNQMAFFPGDFQQMLEIRHKTIVSEQLFNDFDPEVTGAKPYTDGEIEFQLAVSGMVPDIPSLV